MGIRRFGQQGIVFAVFAALFVVFSIILPGFLTTANMLTLLQNVAVLGILGLAMAIVVIGRGIDISLIAALAVPPGLVLQMVQDGHSLPTSLAAAFALTTLFGLANGWLIAYAEVPSLFTTLASGLFLAGLGQAALFKLDVVQWSPGLDGFERLGQGNLLGIPMPIVMFALSCIVVAFLLRRTRIGAYIYAIGDNPYAAQGYRHSDAAHHRAAICHGGADRLRRRPDPRRLGQQHADPHLQFDLDLRCHPGRRTRRHRTVGRPRRRPQCHHRHASDRHHAQRHDHHGRLLFRPEPRQGRGAAGRRHRGLLPQSRATRRPRNRATSERRRITAIQITNGRTK